MARQSQPTVATDNCKPTGGRQVGADRPHDSRRSSTRLLLLATLLEEYTKVSKLVFANSGDFVGTGGLSDTRRAIGEAFPAIARTVNECLPERRGFPPADIPEIVRLFAEKLQQLGGEEHLMQPVALHVVKDFRGFNRERLQFQADHNSILRQQ